MTKNDAIDTLIGFIGVLDNRPWVEQKQLSLIILKYTNPWDILEKQDEDFVLEIQEFVKKRGDWMEQVIENHETPWYKKIFKGDTKCTFT